MSAVLSSAFAPASLIFALCFALVAVVCWAAVTAPGRVWRKAVALAALFTLIPAGYGATQALMGLPLPARVAFFDDFSEYRRVVGYDIHEDRAIFLWLDMRDGRPPRVFGFPYDLQTVARLQKAEERATSLASPLLARLEEGGNVLARRLAFTSDVEFRRDLPAKPTADDESPLAPAGDGQAAQ